MFTVDAVDTAISLSGTFSGTSSTFIRNGMDSGRYYYDAYLVTPQVSAEHIFYTGSDMDMYGYLYSNSFSPSQTVTNLQIEDDDSAGDYQFQLSFFLEANTNYIVVATTYDPRITGSYTFTMFGPGSTTLTRLNPSMSTN